MDGVEAPLADPAQMELPEDEVQRLRKQWPNDCEFGKAVQCAKNDLFMRTLALGQAVAVVSKRANDRKGASKERTQRRSAPRSPQERTRSSARVANLPAPNYKGCEELALRVAAPAGVRKRRGGRGSRGDREGLPSKSRSTSDEGWQESMALASTSARRRSDQAAKDCAEGLVNDGKVACFKAMSRSQVAGGFWNQLPFGFHKSFRDTKQDMMLHFAGPYNKFRHVKPAEAGQDLRKWPIVFLPKGGGAGLSGGWRGFALDNMLFPNDSVVYEKMDATNIKIHVFRAHDYETEESRAAAKEEEEEAASSEGEEDDQSDKENQCSDDAAEGSDEAESDEEEAGSDGKESSTAEKVAVPRNVRGAAAATMAQKGAAAVLRSMGSMRASAGDRAARRSGRQAAGKAAGQAATADIAGAAEARASSKPAARGSRKHPAEDVVTAPAAKRRGARPARGATAAATRGARDGAPSAAATATGRTRRAGKRHATAAVPEKSAVAADEEGGVFYVRHILDWAVADNGTDLFKVHWWNYGSDADSWEPKDCLTKDPLTYAWIKPERRKAYLTAVARRASAQRFVGA